MKALPICWGDGPPPTPGGGRGEGLGDGSADMTTCLGRDGLRGGTTMEKDPLYNRASYFRLGGNPFLFPMLGTTTCSAVGGGVFSLSHLNHSLPCQSKSVLPLFCPGEYSFEMEFFPLCIFVLFTLWYTPILAYHTIELFISIGQVLLGSPSPRP